MGHDHAHGSGVHHRGRLAIVLALTCTVLLVEAVVAWITGSLALLADAGHMLGEIGRASCRERVLYTV